MASVTLDNVRKVYPGGVEAVKGVTLAIPDGSFTVLLGPSGCGKSTLLRMIAGLETISGGTISIGGKVVNDVEPAARDIAMVFQNYALYPHMRVYDNMAYGLRNRGVPKAEIEARVAEAAKLLGIDTFLNRKPRELSGGQRQRVAMGRAIVREPQAFLFDEPLSNLDAKLRVQMRVEIRRLHNRLAATSIFVTHDQVEAMTLADTVVVMNQGRIEQVGAPTEVYRWPATRFVAAFIGSPAMNLLPGRVVERGTVELPGGRLAYDPDAFAAAPGAKIEVGVRPEDFRFHENGDGLAFARDFVEELGATRLVHGSVGDAQVVVASVDAPPNGAKLVLSAERADVHLFDPTSGSSLRGAAAATA
ncbi:MAG TPA: sn-glycerol-3-phosphate ABC transporter ATP-binding protein UgpC [Hyphomicrobiaceae bacterium]|nr:sn-glycerol-3-phosphate ABC transporter ATP-binding protein UgpC [Hyphomicrobiaceae bacterium]